MKKIAIALSALLIVAVLAVGAFADMGYYPMEERTMLVGKNGIKYRSHNDGNTYGVTEFGSPIVIVGTDNSSNPSEYIVKVTRPTELVYASVSASEYGKLLYTYTLVTPDYGIAQKVPRVKAEVTPSVGLNIRYGPHKNFDIRDTMPMGTVLYYEYVYNGWAYTEYRGMNGWASLDFLRTLSQETETQEVKVTETTQKQTEPPTESVTTAAPATEAESESETEPVRTEKETEEITDFVSADTADDGTDPKDSTGAASDTTGSSGIPFTTMTVIFCVIAALIVSAAALATVLIIIRKGVKPPENKNGF